MCAMLETYAASLALPRERSRVHRTNELVIEHLCDVLMQQVHDIDDWESGVGGWLPTVELTLAPFTVADKGLGWQLYTAACPHCGEVYISDLTTFVLVNGLAVVIPEERYVDEYARRLREQTDEPLESADAMARLAWGLAHRKVACIDGY